MSFILDALRKAEHTKSEHQSLKVPSPTIVNDELPARPRTEIPGGLLWVLPGMLMLAIGIWALLPKTTEDTNRPPLHVSQDASAGDSAPDRPRLPTATTGRLTTPPQTGSSALQTSAHATRRDTGARALDQVARQGQAPRAATVIKPSQAPLRAAVSIIGNQTSVASQLGGRATPGTVTIAPEGADLSGNKSPALATTRASQDPANNQAIGTVGNEVLPEYRSVLVGGKIPLPQISLDMHVYSSTPSKRFVFINLNKLGEGEQLDNDTSIEAILPDGAVLNHKGFRFVIRPD